MCLEAVQLLLQGDKPAWSQVDVLEENPATVFGGRVDCLQLIL
jgi:hypothetical protein